MYGDDDLNEIANQLLQLCQSHEDVYDIYNICLRLTAIISPWPSERHGNVSKKTEQMAMIIVIFTKSYVKKLSSYTSNPKIHKRPWKNYPSYA